MYKEFSATRFRSFSEVSLPLAPITIVGGKNNVGKTSLLEALWLLAGAHNPELPLRLNAFRGVQDVRLDALEAWGWLFHQRDTSRSIILRGLTTEGDTRQLVLTLGVGAARRTLDLFEDSSYGDPSDPGLTANNGPDQINLTFTSAAASFETAARVDVANRKIDLTSSGAPSLEPAVFLISQRRPVSDDVRRFSELQAEKMEDNIVAALQIIEPELRRIVVSIAAEKGILQADIGLNRLVPVGNLGDGIGRYLSTLLAVSASSKGIVLIDEFENGIHYSLLEEIWRSIARLATLNHTQIVATTHSLECIRAAASAFAHGNEHEVIYNRLSKEEGKVTAVTYSGQDLLLAAEHDFEVR